MLIKLLFDVTQRAFSLHSDFAHGVRVMIFMRFFMMFYYVHRLLPAGMCASCVVCVDPK
jgi:hypothetical protein